MMEVVNYDLNIGQIQIIGVANSSFVLVGDTKTIQLATLYDTPPESLLLGPFVPLALEGVSK